ncbi:ornithine cyclodeaminase family protein [Paraburkholderia agricolaris]|uniref:Ornithine cyclodeaminase family protein n=1 Tax=Paraburkholderia agricolaris TaxID=2152888 RepID=A0ABW8ZU54_9BURK
MPPLYFDANDVLAHLDYPGCIMAVRDAMTSFTASAKEQPLRTAIEIEPGKVLGIMPGFLPSDERFGAKVLSVFEDHTRPGRSAHRGSIVLFNTADGTVECVADAEQITLIRTAAASAVATDALARPSAKRLVIFGCGAQARSHILAIQHVRSLREIVVWGRNKEVSDNFAERMKAETNLPIRSEADAKAAAANADIICTVTGAQTPILLGQWVRPGTHVNVVGSSHPGPVEIDDALVLASRFVVDSRRSALSAAAEYLKAKAAGLIDERHIVAEIGEVLLERVAGRTSESDITLYKSLGHVVQDLAAAAYIRTKAGLAAAKTPSA